MLLAAVLAVTLAADGGTPVYYHVPAGSLLDLRDGDEPFSLPAGVFFPEPSFKILDSELKRLQLVERAPQEQFVIPVQGYLIMAGIVAGVFLTGGIGLGWYFADQRSSR